MIKTNWTNSRPMPLTGMAVMLEANAVDPFREEDGFDICICNGCDYEEDAYVNNGGPAYKNDYKTFIAKRRFASDTITFELYKSGALATTLNSSTYGVFYDFGDALFVNTEVNFPDYKMMYVDWNLVQQGLGYGQYTVRIKVVSLGVTYNYDSHIFNVVEFKTERADNTVKIEGYQNGNLEKWFDFTGLNIPQMMRIKGKFGDKTPTYVVDDYKDYNRKNHEIQSEIQDTFTLSSELLPANIFNYLNYILVRANSLFITDYCLLNQEIYRSFPVKFNGFKEVKNHELTRVSHFQYEFKHKTENDIKRNTKGDEGIFPFRPSGGSTGQLFFANFTADLLTADTGDTITFTDTSVGSPTSWYWDFGSGATPASSILQNPTVVYSTSGTKTVTLMAAKVGAGDVEVKTAYLTITNAWDALALDFFTECAADGHPVPDADKTLYNNAYVRMRATANVLTELDYLNIFIMRNAIAEATRKGITARDMIDTTRKGTPNNDYTGAHGGLTGLVGNNSDYGFLTEFNPSTATKYTQNSATYGYLSLSDTGKAGAWTISGIDSGYSKYCQITQEHTSEAVQIINEGATLGSFSYQIPKAYNHNWRSVKRTASNLSHEYENGMLVAINTETSSTLVNNKVGLLGIYNGSWFGSAPGYTPSKIGAYYAGSGALDENALHQIINEELLVPIGAGFNKNIVAIGDSIFSGQAEGLYSAMYQKTITDLADNWTLSNLAASGRFATNMASDMAAKVNPYFNVTFDKNVCWIAIGTNDLASGATGAQLYGYINTIASGAKAAGMTVVISGIMSRKGLAGAQAGFDTQRGNYNTLMLADFDTAHPTIANCWTPSSVTYADVYIDIYADGDFNDADDTTYFNADKTHLNSTGNDTYSTRYCQPLLLTF